MRVLIATIGTRGDVQPYLALAVGLKQAGHDVSICTSPRFKNFIEARDVQHLHLDDGLLQLLDSDIGQAVFESLHGLFTVLRSLPKIVRTVGPIQQKLVDDSWDAVNSYKPDIIVYHPKLFCVPAFAAVRDIPVILAMLCPFHVPTGECPLFGPSLGATYNRWTYKIVQRLTQIGTKKYLKQWRLQNDPLHLSRASSPSRINQRNSIPVMHAYSQRVSPRPKDWPNNVTITGYWQLKDESEDGARWEPSAELEKFLACGPPPLFVGFGSIKGLNPKRITDLILAAVSRTHVRAVLSQGWGGLSRVENTDKLHFIEAAPHSWLFPKMGAVMHHGGAGTTASGLRAGCPTIICPFGMDQPFWGRCVSKLGVGVATVPQAKLTEDKIVEAVQMVFSNRTIRNKATSLAQELGHEDGVGQALEFIEQTKRRYASI